MKNKVSLLLALAFCSYSSGFVVHVSPTIITRSSVSSLSHSTPFFHLKSHGYVDPDNEVGELSHNSKWMIPNNVVQAVVAATSAATLVCPSLAQAVDVSTSSSSSSALPSALAAYGHYLFFGIAAATLVVERVTIQPDMSKDQETKMVIADAIYGISAALILFTGYFRLTQYGKGWDFYSHEPLFWVKMWGFMILGASSLFPTITLIKRAVVQQKMDPSDFVPMSDKLVKRMTTVLNAELLAIFSIPFLASTMARGIGYEATSWLPVDMIGPVITGLLAVGGGIKYATEALTWSEE